MERYCTTIGSKEGRKMYGVDLVEYIGGEFVVIMSRPDLTRNFKLVRRIVERANWQEVPDYLFDELVVAVRREKRWATPTV